MPLVMSLRSFAQRARNSDVVRHGILVFAGLITANILNFLFYSLVSRVVGVEQYGVITSLISAVLLLAVGPATVAGTIVARLAADLRAAGDQKKLRRLGDIVTAGTAAVGFGGFALTFMLASPIAEYLHLAGTATVISAGGALGFSLALPVQRGVFQGAERFGLFALSTIIENVPKVLLCPLLAVRFGVNGAFIGLAISVLLGWLYNVFTLRRLAPRADRLKLDMRRIAITSTNVALAVIAVNALLFYDVILVRHYFSGITAGLYGAAALVARAMYTVIGFIPTVVLPKASARRSLGHRTGPLLIGSLLASGLIVGVAVLANLIAPRLIVSILAGRAFGDAAGYVVAYTFALGALAIANVIAMYNIGLHRFDFVGPLVLAAVAEIFVVSTWHHTVHDVLLVLCIGHGCALLATLIRFRAPSVSVRPTASTIG